MGFVPGARSRGGNALFFGALAGVSLLLAGCGAKPVASVNGQALSETGFLHLCETSAQVNPEQGTVGLQVLLQWIQNTLRAQEARRLGVYPSAADLNARVEMFRKRAQAGGASFEDQLKQRGMTFETFKRDLLDSMVMERVMLNGVNVTEDQIKKAFDANKKRNTTPEQAEISQITLDTKDTMEKAQSELNSGGKFELVASTRSKDRFADSGGKVPFPVSLAGPSPDQRVSPQAIKAAFNLKEGQTSDPIPVGATWVIVRLDRKIPMKEPSLDDHREQIRLELLGQEAQRTGKGQQNQLKLAQLLASADIKVNRPEYQPLVTMLQQQARQIQQQAGMAGSPGGLPPVPGVGGGGTPQPDIPPPAPPR